MEQAGQEGMPGKALSHKGSPGTHEYYWSFSAFCFHCSCSARFESCEIPVPPHPRPGVVMSQSRKETGRNHSVCVLVREQEGEDRSRWHKLTV